MGRGRLESDFDTLECDTTVRTALALIEAGSGLECQFMDTKPLASTGEYDTPTARILLVDERLIFCEGLRKLLEGEPGFTVVGNASDPDDALQGVEEHNPDIVIVSLAGRSLGRLLQTLHGAGTRIVPCGRSC